jgi:small subunit ribosomal protein S16
MVRIRMTRVGRRNRAFFRIQIQDKRERRDGAFIEQVGWYDPVAKDPAKQLSLELDRLKYWLSVGAQPSDTVRDFLVKNGLMDKAAWEKQREIDRQMVEKNKAAAAAAAAAGDAKKDAKK